MHLLGIVLLGVEGEQHAAAAQLLGGLGFRASDLLLLARGLAGLLLGLARRLLGFLVPALFRVGNRRSRDVFGAGGQGYSCLGDAAIRGVVGHGGASWLHSNGIPGR